MKRNPHPARASRITTLGVSVTAFVSIVSSLALNTHQAESAAALVDVNALPVGQVIPVTGSAVTGTATSVLVAPAIAPTPLGVPANGSSATTPTKANKSTTPAAPKVAPATPSVPAPTTAAVAPAAPAATVIYTCMSPGGKTETPSASGQCKNAKYGYVLTQI